MGRNGIALLAHQCPHWLTPKKPRVAAQGVPPAAAGLIVKMAPDHVSDPVNVHPVDALSVAVSIL